MEEVVRLITADAALTAAVLRQVRRADLGVANRAITVDRAVGLLGFRAIRNLVLSLTIYAAIPSPPDEDRARRARRDLWKHSLAVACAAEMLASDTRPKSDVAEAFVGGLLHDIGKMALDAVAPKAYARVLDRMERFHGNLCDAEREVLGIDHTIAGKRLTSRWGLPAAIIECTWLHHHVCEALPAATENPALVALVQVADGLVRRQYIGLSGSAGHHEVLERAARLGVSPEELDDVARRLPDAIEQYCEFVGLDTEVSRTLYAESLERANGDLFRLNSELEARNRELARRAKCFDIIRDFAAVISEQSEPAAVCAAAAESMRSVLGVGTVVVIAADERTGQFYGAAAGAADSPWPAGSGTFDALAYGEALASLSSLALDHALQQAGGEFMPLWRFCTGSYPNGTLWQLPLPQAAGLGGAVLFQSAEDDIGDLRGATAEWRALAGTLALSLASAKARYIAERTNEELLDANRRLYEAQRELVRARTVDMVAQWAAGAAHELNNPLAVISGRAQMEIAQTAEGDPRRKRTLELIESEARRASQIVLELMDFAKPDAPEPESVVVATVLEAGRQRWQARFDLRDGQLDIQMTDRASTVWVDPTHLESVLDALMANAVEFTDVSRRRIVVNSPSRSSDETVRIVVEDNGAGMTAEVLEHAFDPFFSSRPAGRSRGLGLSRSYRLVDINGGQIWIRSTPQIGTIVTVELPACAAGSKARSAHITPDA